MIRAAFALALAGAAAAQALLAALDGNTRAASPVYPAITNRSTATMVPVMVRYCGSNCACGLMNCGSTASMNTSALGLLTLTRKPRNTRLSGLPMGRTAGSSLMSIGNARHCL